MGASLQTEDEAFGTRTSSERPSPPADCSQKPQIHQRWRPQEGLAWYAVLTKRAQETAAATRIAAQTFPIFLPIETIEKWHNRQLIKKFTRPLFARILFVQFDVEDPSWVAINNTRGTQGPKSIICNGAGDPSPIRPKVIEAIRNRDVPPQGPQPTGYAAGQKIDILEGPFAGRAAQYLAEDEKGFAEVLVTIFGRPTPVHLPIEQIAVPRT
jgi:transcriptional antiterminator RfaH